jgi:hypothetical protein
MPDLVPVGDGFQLSPEAAASVTRMGAAGLVIHGGITSAYRSFDEQSVLRASYLRDPQHHAFALPAGQSVHELGYAVDWKLSASPWVRAHPDYGWRFTVPGEWWHAEYFLSYDLHLADVPALPPPLTPISKETKMLLYRRSSDGAVIFVIGGKGVGVLGADYGAYLSAGIPVVAMSDAGFDVIYSRFMV